MTFKTFKLFWVSRGNKKFIASEYVLDLLLDRLPNYNGREYWLVQKEGF